MNAQTCNMNRQQYKIMVQDIMDEMINKWRIICDLRARNSTTKQVNGNAGMTLPVRVGPISGHRSYNSLVGYFTINNRMLSYNYPYVIYSVLYTLLKPTRVVQFFYCLSRISGRKLRICGRQLRIVIAQ